MVKIVIENLAQKALDIAKPNQTALKVFQTHRVDWLHTCGGKGKCTSCKMIVTAGLENLGGLTTPEKNYRRQGLLKDNERLACQTIVNAAISVVVPKETKLPHVNYSF